MAVLTGSIVVMQQPGVCMPILLLLPLALQLAVSFGLLLHAHYLGQNVVDSLVIQIQLTTDH
jgi:hypothetical protein